MEKSKGELAEKYFLDGYNCAQAVVLAFQNEINLSTETLLKMSSSFGGGLGRMREVCGAVSGMSMVLGLIEGYTDPKDISGKSNQYQLIRTMAEEFKSNYGSIVCRELLVGVEKTDSVELRTNEYYKKRPCGEYCKMCAQILMRHYDTK